MAVLSDFSDLFPQNYVSLKGYIRTWKNLTWYFSKQVYFYVDLLGYSAIQAHKSIEPKLVNLKWFSRKL